MEQLSIFDATPEPALKRRDYDIGETVRVIFTVDEIEYVQLHHQELLEEGTIKEKLLDFYKVQFGEQLHVVDKWKLNVV